MTCQVMDLMPSQAHDDDMLTNPLPDTNLIAADPTESRLRRVLTTNATTSGLGGLAAVVAGGPVGSLLGTDSTTWVRLVGAGLVAFAVFVALVARAPVSRLAREVPAISAGDMAWVVGTAVTIALGWYSTRGAVVMGLVGAMVGTFGVAQLVLARHLQSDD